MPSPVTRAVRSADGGGGVALFQEGVADFEIRFGIAKEPRDEGLEDVHTRKVAGEFSGILEYMTAWDCFVFHERPDAPYLARSRSTLI